MRFEHKSDAMCQQQEIAKDRYRYDSIIHSIHIILCLHRYMWYIQPMVPHSTVVSHKFS